MKVKKSLMKIISIVILITMLFLLLGSYGYIGTYLDLGSLLIVMFVPISMIIFTSSWEDYYRAMKIAMGNTEFTTKEYEVSLNAIELSIRCVFISGIIATLAGIIVNLNYVNVHEWVFAGFAISCIALLYALIINIIQYGIVSIIKKELIYRRND